MVTNSIVIILLAMAVGGVVGFEVGQHLARKAFRTMIQQITDDLNRQAETQKAEREKRLEEIQESAKKLGDSFRSMLEAAKAAAEQDEKTKEKEQKKNGIQSEGNL